MVTKDEYNKAIADQYQAQEVINQYHKERSQEFEKKVASGHKWTADELRFSATARCLCGAGLAYPKIVGVSHHWDCSDILMGFADSKVEHTAKLPFAFYEIRSEDQSSEEKATTRP